MADAGSMRETNPNDDNFLPKFGEFSKDDRKNLVLMVTALQKAMYNASVVEKYTGPQQANKIKRGVKCEKCGHIQY